MKNLIGKKAMKTKIISYGQRKNGIQTVEVVAIGNGKSFTHHLWKINGAWVNNKGVIVKLSDK